jgi:protein-S-isoprenylcysteine O-methyltransferase Ste14
MTMKEELENSNADLDQSGNQIAEGEKGAAVKFPPPLIFVLLIFVGGGIDWLLPLGVGVPASFQPVGIAITLFGVAVAILVNGVFKRAGTAIEPWKPTTQLVTNGLYRWSRNPIYAGFCLFNLGIGIATNSLWIILTVIPGAILVYHIAIKKEERYLEEKFGEEYKAYKRQVRRWI